MNCGVLYLKVPHGLVQNHILALLKRHECPYLWTPTTLDLLSSVTVALLYHVTFVAPNVHRSAVSEAVSDQTLVTLISQ